jgi:hypothetical protein
VQVGFARDVMQAGGGQGRVEGDVAGAGGEHAEQGGDHGGVAVGAYPDEHLGSGAPVT